MSDGKRQTRSHLMNLFQELGIHPRGDLGQNFLIDLNLIDLIVREADLQADDVVLEVGAGTGGLTAQLASLAGEVVSVEYDSNMYAVASKLCSHYPNLTLIHADALHNKNRINPQVVAAVDEALRASEGKRLKLVANLPYHVAAPLMSMVVGSGWDWRSMVVTIQWEMAVRMAAGPGTGDYSGLSVWLQSQSDIEIVRKLPPEVFWPRPQIDSAIVRLVPNEGKRARIADLTFYQEFLRGIFTQRRKALRGVLAGQYKKELAKPQIDAVLAAEGLETNARAEELPVEKLVSLANGLHRALGTAGSDHCPS